jgi:ABC-type molybdenum transport system ATPase subunit/photorepair protein PhrA
VRVVVRGKSGSGKSTLCHLLRGEPLSSEIRSSRESEVSVFSWKTRGCVSCSPSFSYFGVADLCVDCTVETVNIEVVDVVDSGTILFPPISTNA